MADQVQYSVLDRRPEHGLSEHAVPRRIGLLCYGALAGGFLTDRWVGAGDPGAAESRSSVKYRLIIDDFGGWAAYQELLAELRAIAARHRVTAASVAIRFVLEQPGVAAVIIGATRFGQMERNREAFTFSLTSDDHLRIRALVDAAPGPEGPVFGMERDRTGRHGRIMRYDLNRETG